MTRIGIGGPVGSGKTAIIEVITPILIERGIKPLIITNDIVTTEDAKQVKRTLKGSSTKRKSSALKPVPARTLPYAKTRV